MRQQVLQASLERIRAAYLAKREAVRAADDAMRGGDNYTYEFQELVRRLQELDRVMDEELLLNDKITWPKS